MPIRRIKLIVNPNAAFGRAKLFAETLKPIVQEYNGIDWVNTQYPRHAIELAVQSGEDGYDLVIAAGGDGTAHEVLNGLMQIPRSNRPYMGIVPIGSGNDFAHAIGAKPEPHLALRQILNGRFKPIDIMRLEDNLGRVEYAGNTVGIGFDATVTVRSRKIRLLRGFFIYLAAVIQTILYNHTAPFFHVVTDQDAWAHKMLLLVLCNGPREGGGFNIWPGAVQDDGWLNYAGIKKVSRLMMFRLLPEVIHGTHGRFPDVMMGKFKKMEIQLDQPLCIHTDGEIWAGFDSTINRVTATIMPSEFQVMV